MLQNRKESLMAIAGILFVGMLSMSGVIDRIVGVCIALVIFAMSEIMTCYHMKQNGDNWRKEAVLGTILTIVLLVLLFQ